MNSNFGAEVVVSVLCITFNHENYIRETLEGFLMQKTNFAFEVLIHEDASTDRTADIIREYETKYPNIFRVIYETENQYNKGIEYCHDLLAPMARGKYIALCEGDDAWIDDKKLQLQVDYMEEHPECSLVTHKAYLQYPRDWSGKRDARAMGYEEEGVVPFEKLYTSWSVATSTFMFRKEIYMPMPEFFRKAPTGDEPLKFYLTSKGTVYYFDRVMSVYNRMSEGSWSARFDSENFEKQKEYCLGYMDFFEKLDDYMELEHHKLFEECIKERIRRLLVFILFSYERYDEMKECLNLFEKSCNQKWSAYMNEKKQAFAIFDEKHLEKILEEKAKDKRIFIYGAGALAKIDVSQLERINRPINGIVVSDGQPKKDVFMGYPVMYLSDFLKWEKENYVFSIAMEDTYAHQVMETLNSQGIQDYMWLYEQIYKK